VRSVESLQAERVAPDANGSVPWLLIGSAAAALVVAAGIVAWVLHASVVNHWLAVHTGTVNESGPYYGFWSGFGSDLAEFGIIGAVGTGVYQLVRKYNCHAPGCWHVGTHPAAGGQFLLCYRHHPDFQGERPTSEVIARLHHEHTAQQAAVRDKLAEIHQRVTARPTAP
jgi:hypothetical protein